MSGGVCAEEGGPVRHQAQQITCSCDKQTEGAFRNGAAASRENDDIYVIYVDIHIGDERNDSHSNTDRNQGMSLKNRFLMGCYQVDIL